MNFPKKIGNQRGQAMAELLLSFSLLLLLAAGMVQFTLLFSAKTSFEQACGQAARHFAAGQMQTADFAQDVWVSLGSNQRFFDQTTLQVSPSATSSLVGQSFLDNTGPLGPFIAKVKSVLLNYSGQKWVIRIEYKAAPILSGIFSKGIPFQTELAVLKYPAQD